MSNNSTDSNRGLSLLLSALMVLSMVAAGAAAFGGTAVAAQSADIVVDDDGGADYTSVQNAIDDASSGDTIQINDGTYTESLTVSTSNLTIVGQSESGTVIDGGLKVDATVDGLTIESLTMKGDRGSSRTLYANSEVTDLTVDSVTFDGTDSVGFAIYGNDFAGDVEITGSTFTGYTDSSQWGTVYVSTKTGLDDVTFTGNDVIDNAGKVEFHGNEGTSGSKIGSLTVTDNTFSGTSAAGAKAALVAQDAASSTIENNDFSDNFAHVQHIDADVTTDTLVSANTFDQAASVDGVGVFSSIQDAVDAASDGDTVEVAAGTYAGAISVSKNLTLAGAGSESTVVETGSENALTVSGENTNVTIDGVGFTTTSSPVALVQAESVGSLNISGASFDGNEGAYGVYVTGTDSLTVEDTTVADASAAGIHAIGVDKLHVADTTVQGTVAAADSTPGHGIHTTVGSTGTFTNVTVTDNNARGIDVAGNAPHESITIADSEISNNSVAVNVFGGVDFEIINNTISENAEAGLQLDPFWETYNDEGGVPSLNVSDNDFVNNPTQVVDESGELSLGAIDAQNEFDRTVRVGSTAIYGSLSPALDAVSSGDTVLIGSGTYEGSFDIDTNNVSLVSTAGPDETTLDIGSERININADNVSVYGVSVVFEDKGIYTGNDNVSIQNSTFELADGAESTGYGIRFEGSSSDGVVYNSEFVGINNTGEGYGNGIVVSGPAGHAITNNSFTNNSIGVNVGSKKPAKWLYIANNTFTEQGTAAIALNHDASENTWFDITRNHIESNGIGILALSGGSINVDQNDIVDNGVAVQSTTTDTVDATRNWWGSESGPAADAVEGDVRTNPYLTVPHSEAADTEENLTEFGFTVEMDAGAHAFGVPGPVEGTVGSIFNDFDGTVYAYADGSWDQVQNSDRELSALDALVVIPEEGETARASIEIAEGSGAAAPTSKELSEGWNFVGTPQAGAIETAYGASSADPARALNLYDTPGAGDAPERDDWTKYDFGTDAEGPNVSPVSGYWVYAEEDGSVAANVPAGATLEEFWQLTTEYYVAP